MKSPEVNRTTIELLVRPEPLSLGDGSTTTEAKETIWIVADEKGTMPDTFRSNCRDSTTPLSFGTSVTFLSQCGGRKRWKDVMIKVLHNMKNWTGATEWIGHVRKAAWSFFTQLRPVSI